MTLPDFSYERNAPHAPVCGIDEAGRGPWAGPVVASAVILDPETAPDGLNDSKKLSESRREALFHALSDVADIGVGVANVEEIDCMNVLQATFLAMRRAVAELSQQPRFALVDGKATPPGLPCPCETIVKGDGVSASIAAASIIAKVTRDRLMRRLAEDFPQYGWDQNKGYGVAAHAAALSEYGVTPHHRRSFAPIHKMLYQEN